LAFAVILIFS